VSIALFYGSSGGVTAEAAERIADALREQAGLELPLFDVATEPLTTMLSFSQLILGCPTWYVGDLQDDWDTHFAELNALDLTGKQVALFGTGDQVCYSDTFGDALGILGSKCLERGAQIVGWWPTEGYIFKASRGVRDGLFYGLALDEDNQYRLSNARIQRWAGQLVLEFGLATKMTDKIPETGVAG
jgi:flavodoxin I